MIKASRNWRKRVLESLSEHRKKFNDPNRRLHNLRLRHFAGHKIHCEQIDSNIRVAHLTDQHVGRVTPMRAQVRAIRMAMAKNPDVVVLTGDFVCHSELFLDDLTEIISKIDCPCFAVLGNHDHWTNAQAVKKALIKGGAEVLTNQNTILEIGHERLQIIGVDDAYTGHADVSKACSGIKKNVASLGLSHIPEQADLFWAHEIPLVLAGHTHAGQVTVAGLHELLLKKIVGHKYIHGFYGCQKNTDPPFGALYVSAGIGAAVMPLRLGEKGKREVAIFDLGASPDELIEAVKKSKK